MASSNAIAQPEIIQVTVGVKFFRDGDSITITEVKATSPDLKTGDKVIVKGHYTLASKPKASLSLFETAKKGPGEAEIRPEQRIGISNGLGEFELSTTLEYDGYLHVTLYSVPEGKSFGGLYFGTAKQMEDIKNWDLRSRYTADSGTDCIQEPKAQFSKTMARFMTCENYAGAGFYWVDTTSGKVWRSDMTAKEKIEWKYCGQPQGAKAGEVGTYVPQANRSGGGVFVLNPATGEGWWTNGKEWKSLGKPTDAIKAEQ
jgi:hypothetical protein